MNDADQAAPFPEENGADLLDEVLDTLSRYVAFASERQAHAITLWTAATHALPAWHHATRLCVTSPMKRCGKSRLMDVVAGLSFSAMKIADASMAALFRQLADNAEEDRPTLFHDEVDVVFGTKKAAENNEDLRGLYNNGYQRDRPMWRCVGVGTHQHSERFEVFSMAMLVAIKHIPDTITDRAVNVGLKRRSPSEQVARFRIRRDGQLLEALQKRLHAWVRNSDKDADDKTRLDRLGEAEPRMPDSVEDRAQDAWEPLFCIAEEAGGPWPQRARDACGELTGAAADDDEEGQLDTRLLSDVRNIFGRGELSFIPSRVLVAQLRALPESPWDRFELTQNTLAQKLKPFGVRPGHDTSGKQRGYRLDQMADAFRRYLRQKPSDRLTQPTEQVKQGDFGESPTRQNPSEPVSSDTPLTPSDTCDIGAESPVSTAQDGFSDDLTASYTQPNGKRQCPYCNRPIAGVYLKDALGRPLHGMCYLAVRHGGTAVVDRLAAVGRTPSDTTTSAPHELAGRPPRAFAPTCGRRASSSAGPCRVRVPKWGDACPQHAAATTVGGRA